VCAVIESAVTERVMTRRNDPHDRMVEVYANLVAALQAGLWRAARPETDGKER
jgi:hypothetical protein